MNRLRLVFEGQWLHVMALALLLWGMSRVARLDAFSAGELWGLTSRQWAWLACAIAVAHQVLVWFFWRLELHGGFVSGALGKLGFELYAVLFAILGIARVVAVYLLAWSNRGTLTGPELLYKGMALAFLPPTIYLFYSVRTYFGFRRALGADHFEPSYRSMPPVREGIYRWTSNGMYLFGFLILWIPGLWWSSVAALWAALFNHLYIWVHYFSTERPDMQRIYADRDAVDPTG